MVLMRQPPYFTGLYLSTTITDNSTENISDMSVIFRAYFEKSMYKLVMWIDNEYRFYRKV